MSQWFVCFIYVFAFPGINRIFFAFPDINPDINWRKRRLTFISCQWIRFEWSKYRRLTFICSSMVLQLWSTKVDKVYELNKPHSHDCPGPVAEQLFMGNACGYSAPCHQARQHSQPMLAECFVQKRSQDSSLCHSVMHVTQHRSFRRGRRNLSNAGARARAGIDTNFFWSKPWYLSIFFCIQFLFLICLIFGWTTVISFSSLCKQLRSSCCFL